MKFKITQKELANIYLKEQTEHVKNYINIIRDLIKKRWRKWAEGRALLKLNWKLRAKKNECIYGNNISGIYSDNLQMLHLNQSRKLLVNK